MYDPTDFPRTYRHTAITRYVVYPVFLLILLGSSALLLQQARIHQQWLWSGIGTLLGLVMLVNLVQLLICKLVVYPDHIEFTSLWGDHNLELSAIKGRGRATGKRFAIAALYPKDKTRHNLYLPSYFQYDEAFTHWLEAIPDLDVN